VPYGNKRAGFSGGGSFVFLRTPEQRNFSPSSLPPGNTYPAVRLLNNTRRPSIKTFVTTVTTVGTTVTTFFFYRL